MCRLFPCIPIFRWFFLLKVQKRYVYVIILKIALIFVKNVLFRLKKGMSELLHWATQKHFAQGDPPPQFPCLVGHSDLSIRKTPRVVDLLTVTIFFQSKKIYSMTVKDEKRRTIFYFLMVSNLLKIIHLFESNKYLKTS